MGTQRNHATSSRRTPHPAEPGRGDTKDSRQQGRVEFGFAFGSDQALVEALEGVGQLERVEAQ